MYNYRCTRSTCRHRTTLRKLKEQYLHDQHCKICGGNIKLDREVKQRSKRDVCHCDGIYYPHRTGTEPWCRQAVIGPKEEDLEARYAR